MNRSFFITLNSFLGFPPVKHLVKNISSFEKIVSVQCDIKEFENYFKSLKIEHNTILTFSTSQKFNSQNVYQKILKYIIVTFYILRILFLSVKGKSTIYAIDLYCLFIALIFKRRDVKIVYLQYEMIDVEMLNKFDRLLFRIIKEKSNHIDLIVTPEINRSAFLKNLFIYSNPDIYLTIPNTNNFINRSSDFKKNNSKIIITHVGAVGLNHHIKTYLNAISKLNEFKYEFRFIGLLKNEVIDLIRSLNRSNIIYYGQVYHSDLHNYYLETDIGVILYKDISLNHRFCAPNKLYEYWSYGIPVLGDNLPGLKGVFTKSFLGDLVDMNDPYKICESIISLSNKSDRNLIMNYFQINLKLDLYLDDFFSKLK
jgi:hypothetical protein